VQAGGFFLGAKSQTPFVADGTGTLVVSRPFIDANTGRPAAELVSAPGVRAGSLSAFATGSGLSGAEVLARLPVYRRPLPDGQLRIDALAGYRYLYLADGLLVRQEFFPLTGAGAGTRTVRLDDFRTSNRFNGGSFGAAAFFERGAFSAELTARADPGETTRVARITGLTATFAPGFLPFVTPGGFLTQLSNVGTHGPDRFTVVPEVDLRLGWRPTHWLRLTAGYSLLVFTDVLRPGEQIDPRLNPNLLQGAAGGGVARPTYAAHGTDVLIQGATLGLEVFF
jgi:hypothetical protein